MYKKEVVVEWNSCLARGVLDLQMFLSMYMCCAWSFVVSFFIKLLSISVFIYFLSCGCSDVEFYLNIFVHFLC